MINRLPELVTSAASAASAFCLAATSAQGDLVAHWKLDETDGDYSLGGIREEVSGNVTISTEVSAETSITEGLAGLAPDGGTAMSFRNTDPDSYINAGSVESDGTYVTGPATTPFVLGSRFTVCGWFNVNTTATATDRMIVSNAFTSDTGFALGTRGTSVFAGFGNKRSTANFGISANRTYFVAMRQDLAGDTNFGWTADTNNRISLYDTETKTWQHFDGTQSQTKLNLQRLSIGNFTSDSREFEGTLDDIRIYNNTLSQADLDALVSSVSSPFDSWAQTGTNGPVTFDGDTNGDGVKDGVAFLLGVANPDQDATGVLPAVSEDGSGNLVMMFNCLPTPSRGSAELRVAHSNTLASFSATVDQVPDADDAVADNDVTFVVDTVSEAPLNKITATIAAGAAAGGKLFGRLEASERTVILPER